MCQNYILYMLFHGFSPWVNIRFDDFVAMSFAFIGQL